LDDEGAHSSGMLWSLEFRESRGRHLPGPAIDASEGCWTWSHFPLADIRARAFISRMAGLPEVICDLIETGDDRLLIESDGEWTYGVLPDLERDLAGKPLGPGRLFFVLNDHRLVTARLHALRVIDDVRREAEQGLHIESPAAAIVALVEHYIEIQGTRVEAMVDQLDALEDLVLSEPSDLDNLRLGPIRRELAGHRREFQALRRAIFRGRSHRHGASANPLSDQLGQLVTEVEDLDHEAAGLQDRARLLYEEIDTLINSATNRSMRALTVISTLLIPPTLIVGAFGMNLGGIPYEHSKVGFALACGMCMATVAAAVVVLRRLKLL
jgi:zinc transporter